MKNDASKKLMGFEMTGDRDEWKNIISHKIES